MSTILIIDDNRNIREFCKTEFERDGYEVRVARSPRSALAVLQEGTPDLAVMDVNIADDGALDSLARLLSKPPIVPVIACTEYGESLENAFDVPVVACVEKSGDLSELKETVARTLAGQWAGRSEPGGNLTGEKECSRWKDCSEQLLRWPWC